MNIMAETKARIRLKRDSEQNWDRASTVETPFIPKEAEPIYYTDKNMMKIGDGEKTPNDLEYLNAIDPGAVRFDGAQGLSDAEQGVARSNIGLGALAVKSIVEKSDLEDSVQASLDLADTALQSETDTRYTFEIAEGKLKVTETK
jgi:hypothetical protein